jgi:glutathionyl-hydroquinone reductase
VPACPFRGRITADGSSGYPAVAGRYRLYISWACPWAQRTAIARKLLGLEEAISAAVLLLALAAWSFLLARRRTGSHPATGTGPGSLRPPHQWM